MRAEKSLIAARIVGAPVIACSDPSGILEFSEEVLKEITIGYKKGLKAKLCLRVRFAGIFAKAPTSVAFF
jgi:hypothetical protein